MLMIKTMKVMGLHGIAKELGYTGVEHLEMNLDGNMELSKYWEIIKGLYSEGNELAQIIGIKGTYFQ
tara:strand:+ start:737 stop:937 length:201 start_codon:yes stop_codon:yes gene_type:complete